MKASLRNICKDAGVTTGTLYFFFKDKNDLFRGVVGGPMMELKDCIENHMSAEREDKFIVHWMSHDQVDIFVHLLTHCKTEKEAQKQLRGMFSYIIGGWLGVLNNT